MNRQLYRYMYTSAQCSLVIYLPPEIMLLLEELNTTPIAAERIRVWTNSDPLCSCILQFVRIGWPDSVQGVQLKPFANRKDELSVQDGCILWGNWVVIPKAGGENLLRELHEAHPAETRLKRLVRMFVWWPGLDHDIERIVKGCHECQDCWPNPPLAQLIPSTSTKDELSFHISSTE